MKPRHVALIITVLMVSTLALIGGAAAQDATEIEVVGWGQGQMPVYEAFMEAHPDITVTEQMFNFEEYIPFLKTQFLAGEPPDVVQLMPGSMLVEFKDNLLPLDDFIANDPELSIDNFLEPVLGTSYVDGALYGIPQHPTVSGMIWYNADIFDELGLEVPTTYSALLTVSQACRDAGYLPLALNGRDAWNRLIVMEQFFNYAAPGKMQQALNGEIPWTDPDLVTAMGYWKTLADDGVFQDGVYGAGYEDAFNPFAEGRACMVVAGSWFKFGTLEGIRPEATVGNMLPMAFPDVTDSGQEWTPNINASHVFAIAKDTENPEAAWEVLRQIATHGDALANYPVLVPVYDSGIESVVLGNASNEAQLDAVRDFELGAWDMPTQLDEWYYPEIRDAIAEVAAGVGTGQISPEEAMQEVQAVADRVME